MKRTISRMICLLLYMAWITGCGGGGGDGGGNGDGIGDLTYEQRDAAMKAISDMYASLPHQDLQRTIGPSSGSSAAGLNLRKQG